MIKISKEKPLHILNIGTQILVKDVMDQYLRSLGEVKTFYATKLSTAIESFRDNSPHIIFCEQFFSEGGAIDFIHEIGGLHVDEDLYFVLATEHGSVDLMALAVEQGIDELLIKPFALENIEQIVTRYLNKVAEQKIPWCAELHEVRVSERMKRYQESEQLRLNLLSEHPLNAKLVLACGELGFSRGDYARALACAEKVMELEPNNARAVALSARAYRGLGKNEMALARMKKAIPMSPLNYRWVIDLADIYTLLSEEQIDLATRLTGEGSALILRRARIHFLRKDYAGVLKLIENKKSYLSDKFKIEADHLVAASKKIAGLK